MGGDAKALPLMFNHYPLFMQLCMKKVLSAAVRIVTMKLTILLIVSFFINFFLFIIFLSNFVRRSFSKKTQKGFCPFLWRKEKN